VRQKLLAALAKRLEIVCGEVFPKLRAWEFNLHEVQQFLKNLPTGSRPPAVPNSDSFGLGN
jgi:hypothetical protein